jgi:tetratricopeptide (TPR) repeat protein
LLLMGDCFIAVGGLVQARRCYASAVELEPHHSMARAGLAHLHLWLDEDAEAEAVVLAGLALEQDDPQLQDALGHVWLKRQNHHAAVDCFRQTIELDGQYVPAYGSLASTYLVMEKPEDAAQVAAVGLQHDPDSVPCLLAGAQAAEIQEDYARAVALALRGLARDPDNYHAHLIAGRSQLQSQGDRHAAQRHLRRAQELAPDDAPHDAIAQLLSQTGQQDSKS